MWSAPRIAAEVAQTIQVANGSVRAITPKSCCSGSDNPFDAGGVGQDFLDKVSTVATDIESWSKAAGAIHANIVARRRPYSYLES